MLLLVLGFALWLMSLWYLYDAFPQARSHDVDFSCQPRSSIRQRGFVARILRVPPGADQLNEPTQYKSSSPISTLLWTLATKAT